eukprot:gene35167-42597_t
MAIDAVDGALYVTGVATGSLHNQTYVALNDIFLMKFASNGSLLWTKMEGTTGNDAGFSVSVDENTRDVYVGGTSEGNLNGNTNSGLTDIIIICYTRHGFRRWTVVMGSAGHDYGYGVIFDSNSGSVYLTGQIRGDFPSEAQYHAGNGDIVLLRYGGDGVHERIRILGSSGADAGQALAVDNTDGSIFVTGFVQGSVNSETGIWIDSFTGSVYITGFAQGSLHGEPYVASNDIFLIRYTSNGARVWTKMLGTNASDSGFAVIADRVYGEFHVSGNTGGHLQGEVNVG